MRASPGVHIPTLRLQTSGVESVQFLKPAKTNPGSVYAQVSCLSARARVCCAAAAADMRFLQYLDHCSRVPFARLSKQTSRGRWTVGTYELLGQSLLAACAWSYPVYSMLAMAAAGHTAVRQRKYFNSLSRSSRANSSHCEFPGPPSCTSGFGGPTNGIKLVSTGRWLGEGIGGEGGGGRVCLIAMGK